MKRRLTAALLLLLLGVTGCVSAPQGQQPVVTEEEEDVVSEDAGEADGHFLNYIRGTETDANGDLFWAVGDPDTEYALTDLNGDGINELIVRQYGTFIPDIMVYKEDAIVYAGVECVGSAGVSFINTKKQYVSGDTTHASREQYWISEIDEYGNTMYPLYFAKMWDDWTEDGAVHCYKSDHPHREDFTIDSCTEISEEEFDLLVKMYSEENTNIVWQKVP